MGTAVYVPDHDTGGDKMICDRFIHPIHFGWSYLAPGNTRLVCDDKQQKMRSENTQRVDSIREKHYLRR